MIPADENTTVSDKLAEAYRLYVDSRFQLSGNILNSDYYAHVFSKESSGGSLADTVVFTDIKSIFNQASVLYMYRKGYVDPETPDTFGGKATARLGGLSMCSTASRAGRKRTTPPFRLTTRTRNSTRPIPIITPCAGPIRKAAPTE